MTFEEAKNQLEELMQDRKSFICGGDDEIYKADIEALQTAMQALEKQIPRKPIEKSPWVYHCPRCDSRTIEDAIIKKFKFCPDCGQALDWGDTDD